LPRLNQLSAHAAAILTDLPTHRRMTQAARSLAIPDAADRVRDAITSALR
jgi:UDP-N-acetylglucosamine:LPS N-acetylglucosamine transferase